MSDARPTTLLLIRHGATEANERVPYILQGNGIDLPLSETGRAQAASVGKFLADVPMTAVYSSGMVRANETAAAIAEPHGLEVRTAEGIHEVNVGRWEGMNWGDIESAHPAEFAAFRANPGHVAYLHGESYAAVLARAAPAFAELLIRHAGERFAVVAHNVVNRAYLAALLGMPLDRAADLRQSNACVNVITHVDGQAPRVESVNQNRHVPGAWD
ncbi:histidine phosphatase family protein [Alienimonas californiensis]|uniref:Phosphoserine phosphatase 1 n=1 Tax=Alienimonas californiensis TaxID=2527989 RepID=A0A517PC64_9PLAN|nr:histidine phosphatase family protein [Alienimonas californiensis]QDT16962.1 Phosphoserine phosphatase 1 [Alienimonas californiensis]